MLCCFMLVANRPRVMGSQKDCEVMQKCKLLCGIAKRNARECKSIHKKEKNSQSKQIPTMTVKGLCVVAHGGLAFLFLLLGY